MSVLNIAFKSKFLRIAILFFILVTIWWISIFYRGLKEGSENDMITLIYPVLSLFGGIVGLIYAKSWGGFKSHLGRSLSYFSLGLLFQFLGQAIYAYYIYIAGVEIPYPSLGDIGYFGSVIFYILGVFRLGRVAGMHVNLGSLAGKLQALIIPVILLTGSYYIFLKGYVFADSTTLKILLDFGYPLGQALYVAVAILILLLSRGVLGGVMSESVKFLVWALIIQYVADSMFLYQVSLGEWYVGGINDFMYFVSYLSMTIALVYIGSMFKHIEESKI